MNHNDMKYALVTPEEAAVTLSRKIKELRLLKKWKRKTLARRSGVSESSLKRFEQTGKVSLENFLKLMFALGRLDETKNLLGMPAARSIRDLELGQTPVRKRGTV